MPNVVVSALGLVRHLLPVSIGGAVPLAPRLPDVPSFLQSLMSLLGNLGGEAPPAAPEEKAGDEARPDDFAAFDRAEEHRFREQIRQQLQERLRQLPPDQAWEFSDRIRDLFRKLEAGLTLPTETAAREWAALSSNLPWNAPRAAPVATRTEPPAAVGSSPPVAPVPAAAEGPSSRPPFAEEVVRAARFSRQGDAARISLDLDVAPLGGLRIDLELRDRVLQAVLETESRDTHDLVRAHLQSLRNSLQSLGIEVGPLEVRLAGGAAAGAPRRPGGRVDVVA